MFPTMKFITIQSTRQVRHLYKGSALQAVKNIGEKEENRESKRMKEFHEKLKADKNASIRYDDFVLLETDENSGEAVADSEQNPTKWGDWQHGGRVTDF